MSPSFASLACRVADPQKIGFVKFIIESYDGLAVLSTANPERGEILLRFCPDRRDELLPLLDALGLMY